MRRAFLFYTPTLLLTLVSLWVSCIAIGTEAHAAAPSTSITGNTVTGNASTQIVLPPPGGKIYGIQGGQPVGTNLFHSFGQFNVGPGDVAQFQTSNLSPNAAINNILGRVNGQQSPSQIFGTIDSATYYPAANLFLMNPYGFLFGPTATVNVGGMVAFTSADYLRLEGVGGSGTFYADAAKGSILTSSPVAAFGFLGSNPGAITVQGSQLSATPGQGISLVGGNITVQSGTLDNGIVQSAKLSAPGGQINLASVASPGEILAGTMNQAANINGQSFGALGNIQVLEQSHIDASGNGGGTVLIRGGQILLDNSTISANVTGPGPVTNGVESIGSGIDIQLSQDAVIQNAAVVETNILGNATPGVQYGGVHVKADSIEIVGIITLGGQGTFTGIRSDLDPGSTGGRSGDIRLEANSVLLKNFGQIETITQGDGNAGNIFVMANQNIELNTEGQISSISQSPDFVAPNSGNGGNIELTSTHGNIIMSTSIPNVATFVTTQANFSSGDPGNITVSAPRGDINISGIGTDLFSTVGPIGGTGGKGQIQLTANNLHLDNGGRIEQTNSAPAPIGNMSVTLAGSLSLLGQSNIFTTARGPAKAGDVNITAHDVLVTDGSSISSGTTISSGSGGHLNIVADSVNLTNGGQLQSASSIVTIRGRKFIPAGDGGTVTIQGPSGAANSVLIDGVGSGIFTNTQGTGAGGNISLMANSVTVQNGGTMSAATSGTTASATGGTILVKADTVTLNTGGTITASSTGQGTAGQITVQGLASPAQSILIDGTGSGISTDTHSAGAGGNISVNANSFTVQNGGTMSAATSGTSPSAVGGSINVNSTNGVTMTSGGSITASSTGPGNAGNILINAGPELDMQNSSIKTEAAQAGGGNIKIQAGNLVQLGNSTVSTSVLGGTGGGGNITIDPNAVVLQNSQILAQAVQGAGGNISITTNLLLPDSTSIISASSQFGQQGSVTIQSPIAPAGGKVFPLPQKPLLATTLLGQRCAALAGGNMSSFTLAGRDSLPAEPGGWISSPLALGTAESDGTVKEASSRTSESETMEAPPLLSLRHIAPPGFLTQSFAMDSSGCQS